MSSEKSDDKQITAIAFILVCGLIVLVLVVTGIIIKRQITRFKLKTKSGQHIPVGHNLSKAMKNELRRRMNRAHDISYEPTLLHSESNICSSQCSEEKKHLVKHRRQPRTLAESFDAFLNSCLRLYTDKTCELHVKELCILYRHARHEPKPFEKELLHKVQSLVQNLLEAIPEGTQKHEAANSLRPFADIDEILDERAPLRQHNNQRPSFRTTVLSLAGMVFGNKKKKTEYISVPSTESLDDVNETSDL